MAAALLLGTRLLHGAGSEPQAPSDSSRWGLLLEDERGETRHEPVCHKLPYFNGAPSVFDYAGELSSKHSLSDDNPKTPHVKIAVRTIGTIAGRKVVQVVQDINNGDIVMKRLLVQSKGSEFCEIYQEEDPAAIVLVSWARILNVDGENLLMTRDQNGARDLNQEYWTFDDEGPILLDLHVIDRALATLLPKGDESRGDYGLDIRALCYQNPVWKPDECDSCASQGTVAIKLAIKDHQLVVVRQQYDPKGRQGNVPDSVACTP